MEVLSSSKPKARKTHICDWCGGEINKGEIYENQFCKYDGVYIWKNHIRCYEIASKLKMFDECDEGLDGEGFQEYIKEEFQNIWITENNKYRESKEFRTPNFLAQLNFVCDYHLINPNPSLI
jgi:hypothetical protein